ncbi:MAG: M28 family peptidase [Anaerolineae bacterium]
MQHHHLSKRAEAYLQRLCLEIPHRRLGSEGNRAATAFFAETVASFGFSTECAEFDCLDWSHGEARLVAGGKSYEALISPYSLGCDVSAPLVVASAVDELERVAAGDKVLLMRGDLAKEQLMPKNFPFYNPEQHQKILNLLEAKNPAAIVAATSRNPELAGGMYPFPLIEDGDFDIPSVYTTDDEGKRLAEHAGREVSLAIEAERLPAKGYNVIARRAPDSGQRVVLCAHIDAKEGTPGALDNATGVAILLLLAELLQDYDGEMGIEIVPMNGEDHYSAAGQILYLRENADTLRRVVLAINMDAAGYHEGDTAYSLYGCPDEIASSIREAFSKQDGMVEGEQWYQGDHSIFVQNQVPALAITSEQLLKLMTQVTHTMGDRPEIVDYNKLAAAALALRRLLLNLTGRHEAR